MVLQTTTTTKKSINLFEKKNISHVSENQNVNERSKTRKYTESTYLRQTDV